MKFLGFEWNVSKIQRPTVLNMAPEGPEEIVEAHATPDKVESAVRSKQLVYNTSGRSTDFQESDYNLTDVAAAYDTESFFKIAVDRFVSEIWKNGWSFVGKDTEAIAYVKRRFHQIAMVSIQPTTDLFEDISKQLVMYSNAFIEKKRSDTASGGNRWTRFDGKEMIPIAGLFVLDATSMEISRTLAGKPLRYKQIIPNPVLPYPEWPAEDICHVHYSRQRGLAFGTPFVVPVLDDIRALRNMEQNVEILVFQHAVPLYLYTVGSDLIPGTIAEIDALQSKLEEMPKHGVLIVSERHKVEAIGAQGEAINAEPYLEYFKKRVLSGLRLGGVVVGEGNTANRSTAGTISALVQDVAQTFQGRIKIFINLLISEILAEGGFEWDVAQFDKLVELFIPEIDLEKKIAMENHHLELWQGSAISTQEMRRFIGRDPYTDQEWEDTHWKLIGEPKALIQALDEKFVTTGDNTGASVVGTVASKVSKVTTNKNRPANQHGTRNAPKLNKDMTLADKIGDGVTDDHRDLLMIIGYDEYLAGLTTIYKDLKSDVAARLDMKDKQKMMESTTALAMSSMLELTNSFVGHAFQIGASSASYTGAPETLGMQMLKDEVFRDVHRLITSVNSEVDKSLKTDKDALTLISRLEAAEYRLDFIARTQLVKGYNLGVAKASMFFEDNQIELIRNSKDKDGCGIEGSVLDLAEITRLNQLPPYHPNCTCIVRRKTHA